MKRGFTLLEILIVIGIISILVTVSTAIFSFTQKKSRDARRKTDLENIRIALESYRSDKNGVYPSALGDLDPTYMPKVPDDPLSSIYRYPYQENGNDYDLQAYLETGSSCTTTVLNCKIAGTQNCNYCLGPYGQE